jgi:UDP-N-acetyl-D-mannosaminuronic acid dehydrogenase
MKGTGFVPQLVLGARKLNESLPERVARHFIESLEASAVRIRDAKVLVCGFAYKGWPITDDVRGTPTIPIIDVLRKHQLHLYAHDYVVSAGRMEGCGVTVVEDVWQGLEGARGVLFTNEHPDYRRLDLEQVSKAMELPAVVYDCWRLFDSHSVEAMPGIHYASIGYG